MTPEMTLNKKTLKAGLVIVGTGGAGVVISGWQSNIYCGVMSAGAFGYAINSGRIVGENSAKYRFLLIDKCPNTVYAK